MVTVGPLLAARKVDETRPDRPTAAFLASRPKRDVFILAIPLGVAILNQATGFVSGFYAAIFVFIYIMIRNGIHLRLAAVDWLAFLSAVIVLLSPFWAYQWTPTVEASRGIAVTLAYFVSVRWVIRQHRDFVYFMRIIAIMCSVYSIYFLATATAKDALTTRVSVDFANANYTGAVLSFGAVATLWIILFSQSSKDKSRLFWVSMFALQALALFETGSRASVAGLVAALVVLTFARNFWRTARYLTLAVLVLGFNVGFFPQSADLFKGASEIVSTQTFTRGGHAIDSLSGRAETWDGAREVVAGSWLLGAGPAYRYRSYAQLPAHAWGLEYMASVGLLGTSILAALILLCFTGYGIKMKFPASQRAWLWNSATALALVPDLVLSTSQWILWTWVGFALWSRSYLLDTNDPGA